MAFTPSYRITHHLLENIKRIYTIITELNNKKFTHIVLMKFLKSARELSTHASTSIEGNPLPLTEVKRVLKNKPENVRDSEREVLNYNKALENLNKKLESGLELTLDLILAIQKQVIEGLLQTLDAGHFRQKPVVIQNPQTSRIVYIPPDSKDVKSLIEELIEFVSINKTNIDPLILAGIFHKQLVIIHPFMDGNGRSTRLATKVLLAKMGLNTFNLFSFENYYNKNITKYFQKVGEYGDYYEIVEKVDFTDWLEYFTDGIIDELLRVQNLLLETVISPNTHLLEHHKIILKFIEENGSIADRDYAKLTKRSKPSRNLDFRKLIELGFIQQQAKGKATFYTLKETKP